MANEGTMSYNPGTQDYSETHTSRLIVRLELAEGASPTSGTEAPSTAVSYWDTLSGGGLSRTITQRKRPGQTRVTKVPGLHLAVAPITVTRAWNTREEHREPLESLIKEWLGSTGPVEGLRVKVTQMLMADDGTYKDVDYYIGPISGYEGPKGNAEGDDFAKESVTIDPEDYQKL